ncbi:hypothetical protein HPB49_023519 [Dermacentor silvarum]|uniref:Uncharacterized protein n=1 Tax=Dermacentor silvarum TaxID=543639 RepID=A0ACB8D0T1_DERSI|nr:uncharacterized protein LOC119450768 [Dermacentor silvarum]KAH7954974.1 hypothetical protein HPB49_023519 [Dermacentor silvarum]
MAEGGPAPDGQPSTEAGAAEGERGTPQPDDALDYALFVSPVCPELGPAEVLADAVRCADTRLESVTWRAMAPSRCRHTLEHLRAWNEFLWEIRAEVLETRPGTLALCSHPPATECTNDDDVVPDKSDVGFRAQRYRGAVLLFHWLLLNNYCVRTVELEGCLLRHHHAMFFDTLEQAPWLQRLSLGSYKLDDVSTVGLTHVLPRLLRLRELELYDLSMWGQVNQCSAFERATRSLLKRTTSLKRLRLTRILFTFANVTRFVKGLEKNSTLEALHIDWNIIEQHGSRFANYLAGNVTLRELMVEDWSYSLPNMGTVFKALEANRSIVQIVGDGIYMNMEDIRALNNALLVNDVVQSIDLTKCRWCTEHQQRAEDTESTLEHSATCHPFANFLSCNKSLRFLGLPEDMLIGEWAQCFLEALGRSDSRLRVDAGYVSQDKICDLLNLARSNGCLGKFTFRTTIDNVISVIPLNGVQCLNGIVCPGPSETGLGRAKASKPRNPVQARFSHSIRGDNDRGHRSRGHSSTRHGKHVVDAAALVIMDMRRAADALQEMISLVVMSKNLTSLHINFFRDVSEDATQLLADFLYHTRTLTDLAMVLDCKSEASRIIFDGLNHNRSLSTLSVQTSRAQCFKDLPDKLAFLILCSGHLTRLEFPLLGPSQTAQVYWKLPRRVMEAVPLVVSPTDKVSVCQQQIRLIFNKVRMDAMLEREATTFVMGESRTKMAAEAFQRLEGSPELLARVREAGLLRGDQAQAKIKAARERLVLDFFVLTGVVREHVVCLESATGATQIDQVLSGRVLINIVRHLMVSDVVS